MTALSQHCLRHPDRPAVARCPSCGQSYCRECIVEHEFRLLCADCLRKESEAALVRRRAAGNGWLARLPLAATLQATLGLAGLWLFFYLVAAVLQRLPSDLHEGLIWTR